VFNGGDGAPAADDRDGGVLRHEGVTGKVRRTEDDRRGARGHDSLKGAAMVTLPLDFGDGGGAPVGRSGQEEEEGVG
jgi:hypothetical protein